MKRPGSPEREPIIKDAQQPVFLCVTLPSYKP